MTSGFILLAIGLSTSVAPPNSVKSEVPDWLLGRWTGEGELFKNPARMNLSICRLAGSRGMTLNYRTETGRKGSAGYYAFFGHADYFPQSENKWHGRWIGSNKVDHDLAATLSDGEFLTVWQNAAVETGKTSYRMTARGRLQVRDYVVGKDGDFHIFAKADYARTENCDK